VRVRSPILVRGPLFILAACVLLIGTALATPAAADWRRAESPRFILYSDGDAGVLRDYAQKLETFDRLLRAIHGLPLSEVPDRKLPIYLVGSQRDIQQVRLGSGSSIAGFYAARDEDIFAIAVRTRKQDEVLLHEYVHHFMLQNFSAAYPGWLVEGYAEYFMTTDIGSPHISVGRPDPGRVSWLASETWLPLVDVLSKRQSAFSRGEDQALYYSQAWLITHYFMSDSDRQKMLWAYIAAVGSGQDPVAALETATGMTAAEFERALRNYFRGRTHITNYRADLFPQIPITVTRLGAAEDDLMLLSLRLIVGTPEDERAATAEAVRRAAARHERDPFARMTLAHAELHFGDEARGVALLGELLTDHPDHVEALQYLAAAKLSAAREEGDDDALAEARALLARAYALDPGQYRTYLLLARAREGAPGYPNENDLQTWQLAYSLAPQLAEVRVGAARALIMRERFDEAIAILGPVANDPHGGQGATVANQMIALARARQTPPEAMDEAAGGGDAESRP
jgi:Flp pilus assembly protein TadD